MISAASLNCVRIKYHGISNYLSVLTAMKKKVLEIKQTGGGELWLLQHNHVFTLGQSAKKEHLLETGDIPVVFSDRGGQVSYHAPGQLIFYVLLPLNKFNLNVRKLVQSLEKSTILLLDHFNILGHKKLKMPGVFVKNEKIASIGLRISHGISYHGLSLNVEMPIKNFERINPCGYENLKMTQLVDICQDEKINNIYYLGGLLTDFFLSDIGAKKCI
tara:strand:+ start:618 stop:1268 length:651 start_codon:yes stop_codon:yes gene_type:complete